jgi:proteasome lid subunit RPN8/RPN11
METLADALHTKAVSSLEWRVPGKPLSISIPRELIEDILTQSGPAYPWRKRKEVGGVLFGQVEEGNPPRVRIDRVTEIPCQHIFGAPYSLGAVDKRSIRDMIAEAKGRGERAVGFYRTHLRRGLGLDGDDMLLFSEFFTSPSDVLLLLKPRWLRSALGGFFFWEYGSLHPESSHMPFTVNPRTQSVRFLGAQIEPETPVRSGPKVRSLKPPLWCSWWIQGPLTAFVLAAIAILGFVCGRELNRIRAAPPSARDPYALSLTVLQYNDNLHLTWDRDALPVAKAVKGQVSITDDELNRTFDLTPAQLKAGSVLYRKVGTEVRFRLEVFMKNNRSVSESWRRDEAASPPAAIPSP